MKLYEVYTEILNEVGELDPSKAYKFTKRSDYLPLADEGKLEGRQEYNFTLEDNTKYGSPESGGSKKSGTPMQVDILYKPNGQVRVDFGLDDTVDSEDAEPVLGDDYKSLYGIMNTVGAIVLDSLRGTKDKGTIHGIMADDKREKNKANPKQRQLVYQLFLRKAIPGGKFQQQGKYYVLPKNYKDYL